MNVLKLILRSRINTLVFGLLFFCFTNLTAQSWFQLPDFPGVERDDGAGFVIGDKAYCGSGVVPFRELGDFYSFDLITESWDTISPLAAGQERQYAAAFSTDSLGFIFGGYRGGFLNDLWQYDPISDQWTQQAALPAVGRGGAACFVIDSFAYIIGGKTDSAEAISEVWAYNLHTNQWQQKANLPFGTRWRASASSNQTNGFLAFGLDSQLVFHDDVYSYDPILDQWQLISVFPNGGRNYVKLHHFNNKLICIAGFDSSATFINEAWSYDLVNSQWDSLPSLPSSGRRGGISFQSPSAIFYTTGLGANGLRFKESWKLEDPTKLQEFGQEKESVIQLYPNPTNGELTVILSTTAEREFESYRIYDLGGNQISNGSLRNRQKISLLQLPNGIYFLHLIGAEKQLIRKLIKY